MKRRIKIIRIKTYFFQNILKTTFETEKTSLVQQLNEQQTASSGQIRQLEQAQQRANARIRELETTLENAQLNYTRELEIMQERKDLGTKRL